MSQDFCPYFVLGLTKDSRPTTQDVIRAHRKIALVAHTDKTTTDRSPEEKKYYVNRIQEINKARDILTDVHLRAIYDFHGLPAVRKEEARLTKEENKRTYRDEVTAEKKAKEDAALIRTDDDDVVIIEIIERAQKKNGQTDENVTREREKNTEEGAQGRTDAERSESKGEERAQEEKGQADENVTREREKNTEEGAQDRSDDERSESTGEERESEVESAEGTNSSDTGTDTREEAEEKITRRRNTSKYLGKIKSLKDELSEEKSINMELRVINKELVKKGKEIQTIYVDICKKTEEEARKLKEESEKEIEANRNEREVNRKEREEFLNQMGELKVWWDKVEKEAELNRTEKDELNKQVKKLQEDKDKIMMESEVNRKERVEIFKQLEQLKEEKDDAKKEREVEKQERDDFCMRLGQLNDERAKDAKQREELKGKWSMIREKEDKLRGEREEFKKEKVEIMRDLDELRKVLENLRIELLILRTRNQNVKINSGMETGTIGNEGSENTRKAKPTSHKNVQEPRGRTVGLPKKGCHFKGRKRMNVTTDVGDVGNFASSDLKTYGAAVVRAVKPTNPSAVSVTSASCSGTTPTSSGLKFFDFLKTAKKPGTEYLPSRIPSPIACSRNNMAVVTKIGQDSISSEGSDYTNSSARSSELSTKRLKKQRAVRPSKKRRDGYTPLLIIPIPGLVGEKLSCEGKEENSGLASGSSFPVPEVIDGPSLHVPGHIPAKSLLTNVDPAAVFTGETLVEPKGSPQSCILVMEPDCLRLSSLRTSAREICSASPSVGVTGCMETNSVLPPPLVVTGPHPVVSSHSFTTGIDSVLVNVGPGKDEGSIGPILSHPDQSGGPSCLIVPPLNTLDLGSLSDEPYSDDSDSSGFLERLKLMEHCSKELKENPSEDEI